MIDLMKRFYLCSDENIARAAIVDGEYYRENGANRLGELQRHQRAVAPKSYALSIEQLPEALDQHQ